MISCAFIEPLSTRVLCEHAAIIPCCNSLKNMDRHCWSGTYKKGVSLADFSISSGTGMWISNDRIYKTTTSADFVDTSLQSDSRLQTKEILATCNSKQTKPHKFL